jgi:endogenous inhibitor of DNA gyrase (YacG/DUF329 family)
MKKLAWKNLLENACPKCGEQLSFDPQSDKYICSMLCNMMLKRKTVDKLVAKFNKEEYEPEEETGPFEGEFEALDNMGSNTIQGFEDDE